MELLQIINLIANSLICLGMIAFFVLLFGNENSIVQKWKLLQHWTLKLSLVSIIASSAWNALNYAYRVIIPKSTSIVSYVDTPVGEIALNVGLALLFVWVVYFHKYHFMKVAPRIRKVKKKKRISRRKSINK